MTQERPSHLKLIATSLGAADISKHAPPKAPRLIPRKATQLQLPHLDSLTFVLASVRSFQGLGEFTEYVAALRPKWIFDIRTIPRLDVLGGTRRHVFSVFRELEISYIDLLGVLGVGSEDSLDARPSVWGKKLAQVVDANAVGVVLLLFDNIDLLESAALVLPSSMESVMHRPVAVEVRL